MSPLSLPDLDIVNSKEEWDWLLESTPAIDFTLLENLADDLITMSSESKQLPEVEKAEMVGSTSELVEPSCNDGCSTACLNLAKHSRTANPPPDAPHQTSTVPSNQILHSSSHSSVPHVDKTNLKSNALSKSFKIGADNVIKTNPIQLRRIEKAPPKVSEPKIVAKPRKVVARLPKILPKLSPTSPKPVISIDRNCSLSEVQNIVDIPVIIVEDVGLVEEVSTCTEETVPPKAEHDYSDCSVEAYCDQVVNNFDATFKVELDDAEMEMMGSDMKMDVDTLGVDMFGKDMSDSHSDHGYDSLDSPLSDNNEYLSMALFSDLLE